MTILESDIKLLKSAVMADTTDGGGAMTGTEIQDGVSNNIFPDTSEVDRALGRVNMRKVFGVAQTASTDTLLGAHAIITDAPDDPLVGCLLMEATGWGDTRSEAQAKVEQYLVKGPRYSCRLFDTHYAGTLQIRLYTPGAIADFPSAGDAIVLRNPSGTQEQYVRVRKTTQTVQNYNVLEGGGTVNVAATIVTCDLSNELEFDFVGAPMARVLANETANYSSVYGTTVAAGAKFYGIKPLGVAAEVGDVSLTTSGGIYAPLVPAATTETPITDQSPYQGRASLSRTAFQSVALPSFTSALAPSTLVTAPTAIEPGTVSLNHTGTVFVDDGAGTLLQGSTPVGIVDYFGGVITFGASSPTYGSASNTLTYKPATSDSLSTYSSELVITSANQGLAFTQAFEPPPAPGTFSLSYMAQNRWYDLSDNGNGKVAGSDNSYGVGTLSYSSGSLGVTLGALPDVGSVLLATWAESAGATAVVDAMPTRAYASIELATGTFYDTLTATWSNGGTNYSATLNTTTGVLSGNATGTLKAGVLTIYPEVFPSNGVITVASNTAPVSTLFTGSGSGAYSLSNTPVKPGSVSATLIIGSTPSDILPINTSLKVYDKGNGVLYGVLIQSASGTSGTSAKYLASGSASEVAVGTVNYATGAVQLSASVSAPMVVFTKYTSGGGDFAPVEYFRYSRASRTISMSALSGFSYATGATSSSNIGYPVTEWIADVPDYGNSAIVTNDVVLKVGDSLYSVKNAVVRKGWDAVAATASVANAGSMTANGMIKFTSLPSNMINSLTWYNAAMALGAGQSNHGVFRTSSAPLKTGVFQLLRGANVTTGNDGGVLSGGGLTGSIDYTRGIVRWTTTSDLVYPSDMRYNAVFLQFLPLDASLLGLETARLPLDGRVPIYRQGGIIIVHNTQSYALPNPLTKGTTYDVGRVRVAAMKVKTATGATVSSTLYTTDLDAGTLVFPVGSDITGLAQPFTVEHRIEDMMLCSVADISGKLTFTRALTHDFPATTSFVSSALVFGDVFARAYNSIEQVSWNGVWSNTIIGSAPTANYNETAQPIVVTNQGAITERWALIFTNTTTFNIVGEKSGVIGSGSTGTDCSPINPATGVPFFTVKAAGWGTGWATGNVYRFNTAACGAPIWTVRTVLQGPPTLQDDKFTLAFRGDVDRP